MRAIKFCGYSCEHESWIYGDLNTYFDGEAYITEKSDGVELSYQVEADSVGEFSGQLDYNGAEIYEGHYVAFEREHGFSECFEVTFKEGMFWIGCRPMLSQFMIDESRLIVVGHKYKYVPND